MINASENPPKIFVEMTVTQIALIDYALALVVHELEIDATARQELWVIKVLLEKAVEHARTTTDSDPNA